MKMSFFILVRVNKNYSIVEAFSFICETSSFLTVSNREAIFLLNCASLASLRFEWHFLIARV